MFNVGRSMFEVQSVQGSKKALIINDFIGEVSGVGGTFEPLNPEPWNAFSLEVLWKK